MDTLTTDDKRGALLYRTDPQFLDELEDDAEGWFSDVMEILKCKDDDDLVSDLFKKQNKDKLSGWLESVASVLTRHREMVRDLRGVVERQKTEMLESRGLVIKFQGELLSCKTEQIKSMQTTVQATVRDTVEAEIQSYSAAVIKNTQRAAISPETVKSVVKSVVYEEDRSRNLMVFGLEEEPEEILSEKVGEVFQHLQEKPLIEASRIGRSGPGKGPRPVKVTLSSSHLVHQILIKAKDLRMVKKHKSVFICPDRSSEQRAEQRQLVLQMKKKATEDPESRHYIRSGKIFSVSKTVK